MAKRVIALLTRQGGPFQNEDAAAAAAITPGMLCTLNGSGLWIPHGTAGGVAPRNFALERDEMGKDIDTAYAIGDTVKMGMFTQGDRVNSLIATGQNIAVGAQLESAGNGTLRVLAAGVPIARALESVNNTSGVNARLRVEIM
jgi:hypothetical protein